MIALGVFVTVVGALLAAFVERTIGIILAVIGLLILILAVVPHH